MKGMFAIFPLHFFSRLSLERNTFFCRAAIFPERARGSLWAGLLTERPQTTKVAASCKVTAPGSARPGPVTAGTHGAGPGPSARAQSWDKISRSGPRHQGACATHHQRCPSVWSPELTQKTRENWAFHWSAVIMSHPKIIADHLCYRSFLSAQYVIWTFLVRS